MSKRIGTELNKETIELMRNLDTIYVLGTVNEDGTPHTTPVGLLYALNSKTLTVFLYRVNVTAKNIVRKNNVCINFLAENNLAINIVGTAKKVKSFEQFDIFVINISGVDSRRTPFAKITGGIKIELQRDLFNPEYIKKYYELIKGIGGSYHEPKESKLQ